MNSEHSYNVALVGLGMVSGTYVDALANIELPVNLKGVLSTSRETAEKFLSKYFANEQPQSKPQIYPDIEAIAADSDVDFVILTTPPNAREDLIKALAAAGKPVLMEKPVERSLQAATRLCEVCESAGVPLGIVLQHRARPSAQALLEIAQQGTTGPLQAIEISVPWWREQAYYDEPGRGSYARDGGGVMISQAIHTLDLALQFTGPVSDVIALSGTTGLHAMEAEDFVSAGLSFANGAMGSLFCSTACYPGRTEKIILHYKNVSATLESSLLQLHWQDGRSETIGAVAASGAGADPMAFTSDWHRFTIENFIEAIAGKADLLASGRSALTVHALIDALERSGRSGQRETVAH